MIATKKRKLDSAAPEDTAKRLKMTAGSDPSNLTTKVTETVNAPSATQSEQVSLEKVTTTTDTPVEKGKGNINANDLRRRITKLVPPRPFPTVPTSVAATGPRSSHREGRDMICLTRRTSLGTYMRRCKDLILKDGYKTLHLSAMGAAIPHLLQLVAALPPILPFSKDEIHFEITTGTVEVQDEVTPEDEDEDISYQTRRKSTLRVVFMIGDGKFEGDRSALHRYSAGKTAGKMFAGPRSNTSKANDSKKEGKQMASAIVYEEPEQEYMDML